ncbi:MAG: chromosome segregation protein SMC [Phycisphaerales bacterium]|nr:chromosome segregation protein SMC [Phycisphaerales bacterium]
MFLSKIVLHGFKSFADRTEFEFGPGVTAIVGPNGCGKSNILDALRWVLGEQSAKTLRGKQMSDVIFAGSRNRKGATYSEVELTFDNRSGFLTVDQETVVVGRVLFSNGESEYRLNGNACRLKDIRDLLLDTGIGVDAYTIIEQGRVDVLLQSSPAERRELFEEAAGISRYRVRRAEAARRLERTQQNLLRLVDVLDELERQLRSVKLAAGKARNYLEYDARLRELRSQFSLAEYHELEQSRAKSRAEADRLTDQLSAKRAELAGFDTRASEIEHEVQRLDATIQELDGDILNLQSESSALVERIAQAERRMADSTAARTRRLQQADEIDTRREKLLARITDEQSALQQIDRALVEATGVVERFRAERATADAACTEIRRELDAVRHAAYEAARRSALVRSEINAIAQQSERLAGSTRQMNDRRARTVAERETLDERGRVLVVECQRLEQGVGELVGRLRDMDREIMEAQRRRQAISAECAAQKELRSGIQSRLGLLEDMDRRYEGVDSATRSVLEWRGEAARGGGVIGLVADCLRIDDSRAAALAGVLASFENHVVIRDTYAFLAEAARRGDVSSVVNVIALDRLSSALPAEDLSDLGGFVARARDWVHCEPEFESLADDLLGCVVVVDEFERALAHAQSAPPRFVFVALDGRSISTGGRLTVGTARGNVGLIARKSEIRQLRAELDDAESRIELAARDLRAIDERLADQALQRGGVLAEIGSIQKQHAETQSAQVRAVDDLRRVERELQLLEAELSDASRLADDLARRRGELEQVDVEASGEKDSHEHQLHSSQGRLDERLRELSEASSRLTEALVEVGRAAERRAAGEAALSQLRAQIDRLHEERSQAQREAEDEARRIESAGAEAGESRARHGEVCSRIESRQNEVSAQRGARQELRRHLDHCGSAARGVLADIEQAERELHESQVSLREVEVRQEGLAARVREELSLELIELYASYQYIAHDWDAVRVEIDELRGRIARLGNVNLDAIRELEELTPRYDAMIAQRLDLDQAIQKLGALIAELDEASTSRFLSSFETIRGHFQELFRKLFGGGKADIIMEQPENPLETGIEIIARPPGKEPQSISLLSGGEKTMTAIAMLLAVFRSKPSPFVVMDEVDAALDESNVGRFNSVLDEFLAQSQFIVITHNKRTMQSADVLYGITMEEPGVSKRVSVRFEEGVQPPMVA